MAKGADPAHRGFPVLGVEVDAVQIPDVIDQMESWIEQGSGYHWIAVSGMHALTEAVGDPDLKTTLNSADLVVADGMPLVWLGRRSGHDNMERRVYGPELMETFCRQTGGRYRHFLYGGHPDTLDRLRDVMESDLGVTICGAYSPPFRPLRPDENLEVERLIAEAEADVLWVGLGAPKQETWMASRTPAFDVPVAIGVGAAFDFLAGTKKMAPRWMQERGLEWLFRLLSEPRRLWRRYILGCSKFIYYLFAERLGIKRFD